jgi:hypothetical protein
MAEMSAYCKAYLAKQFQGFADWDPNLEALRKETREVDGEEVEVSRESIDDEDILYLHDSYVVTDDVFNDEHVVFDQVTDEWKRFCHEQLDFEVSHYEPIEIKPHPGEEAAENGGEAAAEGEGGGDSAN